MQEQTTVPGLEVAGLKKSYGHGHEALQVIGDITFAAEQGSLTCIVGPSGCGKTTLMKCLAGLITPDAGDVKVLGEKVKGRADGLAMVFQDYSRSLLPWLSVEDNVTFPLKAQGVSRAERKERARFALDEVSLLGFEKKYPWQLSGGMQQRVAIARGVAYQPRVLLMDEPFASLDAQVRGELEDLTLRIQQDTGMTVVLVTHDIDEAVYLGDRVLVLSHRPTTVLTSIEVPLGSPRDQIATRAEPDFVALRQEVAGLIRSQRPQSSPV